MRGRRYGLRLNLGLCVLLMVAVTALWASDGPVRLAVLVDTSRSIRMQDLARARTVAVDLLRSLPQSSAVTIYSFDDRPVLMVPRTSEPDALERTLASLSPGGSHTLLFEAIFDAASYLQEQPRTAEAIVVLTDGKDVGSANTLLDAVRQAQRTGIPVFSIGIGRVFERDLRRIAKLTDGAYLPIDACRGEVLASLIAEKARRVASAPQPVQSPPSLSKSDLAGTAAPVGAVMQPPEPSPARPRDPRPGGSGKLGPALWWALLGSLLAVALGAAALLLRRRARSAQSPSPAARQVSTARIRPPADLERPAASTAGTGPPSPTANAPLLSGNRTQLIELGDGALAIRAGNGAGQVFPVSHKGDTIVGRGEEADIQLPDFTVSEKHCRITARRGFFLLQDLHSTNGTLVNGERVQEHVLRNGDVLTVGKTDLEFHATP
jgi:hypothetical protein